MEQENQTPTPAPVKKSAWERFLFFVLIPVVVVLLFAVGYLVKELRSRTLGSQGGKLPISLQGDPNNLQGGNSAQPLVTPSPTATSLNQPIADHGPETWISVQWMNPWKQVKTECSEEDRQYCDATAIKQFSAGTVTDGEYKNYAIFIEERSELGTSYRYFVKSAGKIIYFDQANIQIRGIDDLPEYIQLPGSAQRLRRFATLQSLYKDLSPTTKIMTDYRLGDIYLDKNSNCFIAKLPNGIAISYSLEVPFIKADTGIPQISFADGKNNADAYNFTIPSCGWLCEHLSLIETAELNPESRLAVIGTATGGELIYGIRNPNDKVLKDIYNDKNTIPYSSGTQNPDGTYQNTTSKYTYQQFIALHPLIYWKDALGRWVEFRNQRVAVAAEMCKPVIYLYPTKQTNLGVYVMPNGGLTKTIPEYGNGWQVLADPSGKIVDRATGKSYDYLFWEGIGLQYPAVKDGFVIATKDTAAFFDEILPKLGLAGREITDFKEYWVARLQNTGKPYALIHFLDDNVFGGIAPIRIDGPQPNSVIRVMMTAKVMDSKINIPEQKLEPTPARKGFVYAEWGGALLQ